MADFRTAVLITLQHEGGFQNDPKDHANWSSGIIGVGKLIGTKYGITALDMPGVDIANLTEDQAVTFYAANYWKQFYSQIVSQPIANKLFDFGVLFGVGHAVKALQFALNLNADGSFGPASLAATNAANPDFLLTRFQAEMTARAEEIIATNPNEAGDLKGWENRIAS